MFDTTRWSLVAAAGADADSNQALEELCRIYWPPVYAYVRRKGYTDDAARDLVQEFFCRLLDKNLVAQADAGRGKFRTFLLTSVQNFLHNEWDRANAQKRAGDRNPIPIDAIPEVDAGAAYDPAESFDRQWALTILDRALIRLRDAQATGASRARFEPLRRYLTGDAGQIPYADLAIQLGMSEGAVKTAVHRLRRQYGDAIRDEVRETLAEDGDVDDEIRYLMQVLGRRKKA